MSLSGAGKVVLSGLEMQRARMELIASNLANSHVTRTPEGGPYRRRMLVVSSDPVKGASNDAIGRHVRAVDIRRVQLDEREFEERFQPGHPDANAQGYVAYPNVNPNEEMVDLLSAVRSYEANVNVFKSIGQMKRAAMGMVR